MHVRTDSITKTSRLSRYGSDDTPQPDSPTSRHFPRTNQQPANSSASFGSASPFLRKLRWRGRDELDFGCSGESSVKEDRSWTDGPDDFSDPHYGHRTLNRSSVASSIPSLTHSRAHSSSSDASVSTVDSSLPPSPTPSCGSMPLPYTSRVPLTPRTAERKRRSDEVAAVDALNDYFNRVRLSRVEEDDVTAYSRRASPSALGSACCVEGLQIEFTPTSCSTFTPLAAPSSPDSAFTPFLSLPASPSGRSSVSDSGHSNSSGGSTIEGRSPCPEADMAGQLDALSAYFNDSTPPPAPSSSTQSLPSHAYHARHQKNHTTVHTRSTSVNEAVTDQSAKEDRPRFLSQYYVNGPFPSSGSTASTPERRVPYGWI
ncbi:hypothetical protein P7C70_g3223, partial [Phenoliferia sp. Uapishka_3]